MDKRDWKVRGGLTSTTTSTTTACTKGDYFSSPSATLPASRRTLRSHRVAACAPDAAVLHAEVAYAIVHAAEGARRIVGAGYGAGYALVMDNLVTPEGGGLCGL